MDGRFYWEDSAVESTLMDRSTGSKLGTLTKEQDNWVFRHLGREVLKGPLEGRVRAVAEEVIGNLIEQKDLAQHPDI